MINNMYTTALGNCIICLTFYLQTLMNVKVLRVTMVGPARIQSIATYVFVHLDTPVSTVTMVTLKGSVQNCLYFHLQTKQL